MTAGRHFLQIPGPSNVPDRILRAMDYPTMDHRGPAFADVGKQGAGGHEDHLQDRQPRGHLPVLGHRRMGGRAGEHVLARATRC